MPKTKYVVEQILNKRFRNNKTEYLLKWKDYEDSFNSWEPYENLICPDLLNEFEANFLKSNRNADNISSQENFKMSAATIESTKIIPEKLMGAIPKTDKDHMTFLIKWKNIDEPSIVDASWFCNKYPNVVIKFYEERLRFIDEDKPESSEDEELAPKINLLNEEENYNGWIPDKLIGATKHGNKIMFLTKWKYDKEPCLVSSSYAYSKYPQIAIQFFEDNLRWYTSDEEEENK